PAEHLLACAVRCFERNRPRFFVGRGKGHRHFADRRVFGRGRGGRFLVVLLFVFFVRGEHWGEQDAQSQHGRGLAQAAHGNDSEKQAPATGNQGNSFTSLV